MYRSRGGAVEARSGGALISNPDRLAATILGIVIAVAIAIAVLGWGIGRVVPRARFVAPFALAAIPAYLVLGYDRAFQVFVMAPCLVAASAVTLYWLVRLSRTARPPTAGETRPRGPGRRS